MRRFDGIDLYNLDSLLSDDEKAVREAVRGWVDENVIPIIEGHCRAGTFPRPLVRQMGEMGLLGVNLTGYGCAGMSNVAYGLVCQELERGDSGIRSFASVQGSLVMFPIWKHGSEAQKQAYLPKLASGEFIGCFGLTEPDFGSNPGGMITKAVDDGDSYVLNGVDGPLAFGMCGVFERLGFTRLGFTTPFPTTSPPLLALDFFLGNGLLWGPGIATSPLCNTSCNCLACDCVCNCVCDCVYD